MKKLLFTITLTMLCWLTVLSDAWANLPAKEQKEQVSTEKKAQEAAHRMDDNRVSYGTLPVFKFLLSSTISAFRKSSGNTAVRKEEACFKPKANAKGGAC